MDSLKRGIVSFLFVFIVSIGIVNAELIVNGPEQTSVNIGDTIEINGYVLRASDVLGLLKFELKCGSVESVLITKSVSLKSGEKKDFYETFSLSSLETGSCSVKVSLESNDEILESKTSSLFEITSELTGSFNIDKESVQAGEEIFVGGSVYEQSGEGLDGFAVIILKKEGTTYFSDTEEIKNGELKYKLDTTDIPGGEYKVIVESKNNFGNSLIVTAGIFLLVNKIEVNAHSAKVHYFPKEKVKVTGSASSFSGKIKKGLAYLNLNENKYETDLKNGNFDFSFYLLNTIPSGKHDLVLRVEDEQGNYGAYEFSIIVDAIPTKIVVAVDKEAINPGDSIQAKTFLNDQAGNNIDEDLVVKLLNGKGDIFYDDVKKSGEQFEVSVGVEVVPGNYYLVASHGSVEGEKIFAVGKISKLVYSIDGQTLVVKNIGNVPYEGPLQIDVSNVAGSFSISKKINLGISQEERVDLGKEVVSGKYKITVSDNVFEDILINDEEGMGYWWLSTLR